MKKVSRKKITIQLENNLVEKIEYIMAVLKIRTYNSILTTALMYGYSIEQLYEYAKTRESVNTVSKFNNNDESMIKFI